MDYLLDTIGCFFFFLWITTLFISLSRGDTEKNRCSIYELLEPLIRTSSISKSLAVHLSLLVILLYSFNDVTRFNFFSRLGDFFFVGLYKSIYEIDFLIKIAAHFLGL